MSIGLFLVLILAQGVGVQAPAPNDQSPPPHSSSLPADARNGIASVEVPHAAADILKLASDMNGLDVPSAKPWHIKLSYDQFDEDGDNVHSGTLEEFYSGPKKFKRIYTSDTVNRIDFANDAGLFRAGDQTWPSVVESGVLNSALHPLYLARWDNHTRRPEKTDLKLETGKLSCVTLRDNDTRVIHLGAPVFCFEPGTVMLRYVNANLAAVITYDNIVPFQGHYIARDITIRHVDKPFLKIHVEELGEITKISDGFFAPPSDAKGPLGGRIPVPSSTYNEEYQISSPQPSYPRGVSGMVHVKYVVGKDGNVIEATANDGPEELRKAVLKAVRKYRFRPYLLLDQAVEVESSIDFTVHSK
jgi:TonB family protein